jgi:hypothetical protein
LGSDGVLLLVREGFHASQCFAQQAGHIHTITHPMTTAAA